MVTALFLFCQELLLSEVHSVNVLGDLAVDYEHLGYIRVAKGEEHDDQVYHYPIGEEGVVVDVLTDVKHVLQNIPEQHAVDERLNRFQQGLRFRR